MKKNWKERIKAIIVLILEAGFCLYLAWVTINGFIICPEGLSQKELIRYLLSCVFLVIIISGGIFYLLRYSNGLENNAISGLKQTVLRSKTDAMRSERTSPVDIEICGYLIMIKAIGKWYESFKEDALC